MSLLIRLLFVFSFAWTSLYGDWFNPFSFLNKKKPTSFFCPHQCGQLGSEAIQEVEWKFISLLYQANEIHYFLSICSQPYSSEVLVRDPSEQVTHHPIPQDFRSEPWYQAMIQYTHDIGCKCDICYDIREGYNIRWICLGIDDLDRMRSFNGCKEVECHCTDDECCCDDECTEDHCWWSYNYIWGIKPMTTEEEVHIGHIFTKKESNYVTHYYNDDLEEYLYRWDCIPGTTFTPMPKVEYRFDSFVDFKEACFNLNHELIWLREDVHGLNRFVEKQEVRSISDMQYKEFLKRLEDMQRGYSEIFSSCMEKHQAPSAFLPYGFGIFSNGRSCKRPSVHEKCL